MPPGLTRPDPCPPHTNPSGRHDSPGTAAQLALPTPCCSSVSRPRAGVAAEAASGPVSATCGTTWYASAAASAPLFRTNHSPYGSSPPSTAAWIAASDGAKMVTFLTDAYTLLDTPLASSRALK